MANCLHTTTVNLVLNFNWLNNGKEDEKTDHDILVSVKVARCDSNLTWAGQKFDDCTISGYPTLFKKGIRLDFGTCEHGNSLEGMHLILLDHTKLDFKFERAILEKNQIFNFFY